MTEQDPQENPMNRSLARRSVLLATGLALLGAALACAPLAASTPKPIPASTPTPTPQVMSDCFRSYHMAAWNETNRDGVRQESEPPLAGVEFRLTGQYAELLSPQP